ncbi:MAG: autotransporter-associated beta strand repeat-containing protein [Opitutaceae bacterium]|nr:autotransporter-associated beta strand repeat-containing protein [Opitutaceae bacterium]
MAIAATCPLVPLAYATDGSWSSSGALTGVTTTWETTSNWDGGTVPSGTGAIATIQQNLTGNVNITTSGVTLGTINFSDTGSGTDNRISLGSGTWTFATSSGTPTINIGQSGDTIDIPLQINGATITGSQGLKLSVASGVTWTGVGSSVRIGGAVTWTSFTGALTLDAGRFTTENANVLPSASELVLSNGTYIRAVGVSNSNTTRDQTIGGLSSSDSTTIISGGDNATATGNLTINTAASTSYTFAGKIGANIMDTGAALENSRIAIIKNGTGTQKFSGANIYAGTTTINDGTLLVNGTHIADTSTSGAGLAALTTRGAYVVNSGATLGGTGTIKPYDATGGGIMVDVKSGGIVAPGDGGVGTLTFDQTASARTNLWLSSGALLAFDLGAGLASDRIAFVGNASVVEAGFNGNVINFTDRTSGVLSAGDYLLFDGDTNTNYNGLTLGSAFTGASFSGSLITSGLSIGTGLEAYAGATLFQSGNDIYLNVAAIPEPSAFAAFAGLGALAAVSLRRRRTAR